MCAIEKIALAFMKLFNEPENCFHDEFFRAKSDIIIPWDKVIINCPNFHNILIRKLKTYISELYVVRDFEDITTFNFRGCEVNMDYSSDFGGTNTVFTFTKLSYPGDMRDFE